MTFTDAESAMMPAKEGGIKACYNVQTAVDAKSHMVADFHVTNNSSDRGQLYDSIEMCCRDWALKRSTPSRTRAMKALRISGIAS